jgi:hypothetical protein
MRALSKIAAAAAVAGLLLVPAASAPASAAAAAPGWQSVRLTGGHTELSTAPGIAAALLSHGIVPIATLPGTEGASAGSGGVTVRFTFPVTGGQVNLQQLSGTIIHQGGILFLDPVTGKQILVSNFVISLKQAVLTAEVNGNPKTRVPLLQLGLGHITVRAGWHFVQVSGIVAHLTQAAATALNATFSTTLFTAGLELGTASTLLQF